jgi:DNA-binding response OmpR family regulator
MQIAILESDLGALDCTLQKLSAAGHLCFGALSDESLRGLLDEMAVDLVILDWAAPDAARYDTLRSLNGHDSSPPIVLCVTPCTSDEAIFTGLERGGNICLEKPLNSAKSLAHIRAFGPHSDTYSTAPAFQLM